MSSVFITGVSSGIGHALAKGYLARGWRVYGLSRRRPDDLVGHDAFSFVGGDLSELDSIGQVLQPLLGEVRSLDLVVLNAGVLGTFADLADVDVGECRDVMAVNLWTNKVVLDWIKRAGITIKQVVGISSGAAVNGNRGWAAYSLSKAALNMLMKLYARENPDTHYAAFAPGLVDTAMQDQLAELPADLGKYPALKALRDRRNTPEMPKPDEAADRLIAAIEKLPRTIDSGEFVDIRKMSTER